MANYYELTAFTGLDDADLIPAIDTSDTAQSANGSTRKITAANVKTYMSDSPMLVTPALGTPSAGNLGSCTAYEGTAIASTGEVGGTKFLREDGDGTCSWQAAGGSSPEGTAVLSTGEVGGTKFLREDGDGTCSWQAPAAGTPEGTAVLSTGEVGGTKFLREDGDGTCSWQTVSGAGASTLPVSGTFDGGGSALTVGTKVYVHVPYSGTISKVTLLADVSGSVVVDVWKDTYANYPPTVADTIAAAAKPTISTAVKSQDSTLTGWTTSVSVGDIIVFNVDSVTSITWLTVQLEITL